MSRKMQTRWLMYNPIKKGHGTGTRAVHWKCCLREYSRVSRIHVSLLEITSQSSLFSREILSPNFPAIFMLKLRSHAR